MMPSGENAASMCDSSQKERGTSSASGRGGWLRACVCSVRLRRREKSIPGCSSAACAKYGRSGQSVCGESSAMLAASPGVIAWMPASSMRHSAPRLTVSSIARCEGELRPKAAARSTSRCDLRRGNTICESASVSIHCPASMPGCACRMTKPWSKRALWATRLRLPANSASAATASCGHGASSTSSCVMPVSSMISGGMVRPGSTKV